MNSLANLKSEFSSKTTVWALSQLVSFNSKRERNIALKMARKFSLDLPLLLRRKVQTFQAAVRAKAAEFAVSCWGDFFFSASHILCLHLRPRSLCSYSLKKEMACIFCRTRVFRCIRLVGIGEIPLRLHRRGARCLKCGIKPNKS